MTPRALARDAYQWIERRGRQAGERLPVPLRARMRAVRGGLPRKYALIEPAEAFMFVAVPKAANSTVRRILWRVAGVEVADEAAMKVVHDGSGPYHTLPDLRFWQVDRVVRSGPTFRFTFVRNPYARLRSAYRQKVLAPHPHENAALYLRDLRWRAPRPPSFAEFVRKVVRQSGMAMNSHWQPQWRCAFLGIVPYDLIGRVESFERDMKAALAAIGADPSAVEPGKSVNRTPSRGGEAAYDAELADLVFRRYRKDFDLLGYSRESWREFA